MIGGRHMLMLAAVLGLASPIPAAATADVARIACDEGTTQMRKARERARPMPGGVTRRSGKRCALCGTGGHARSSKHGRKLR